MLDWKYRPKTEEVQAAQKKTDEIPEETPEGFASKNIKTIAFLITLGVLLALIGPISIFHIYEAYVEAQSEGSLSMTQADVIALSKYGAALKLEQLTVYRGELGENDARRTYHVTFDHYVLFAVESKETKTLDFCLLTDTLTEDSIDIRVDNVEAFLASH